MICIEIDDWQLSGKPGHYQIREYRPDKTGVRRLRKEEYSKHFGKIWMAVNRFIELVTADREVESLVQLRNEILDVKNQTMKELSK